MASTSDQSVTWKDFSRLKTQYGIAYQDQNEGGPALIGIPIPQPPKVHVVRPGATTDPARLLKTLQAAILACPEAFPRIDALEADLTALGVEVRGDLTGDIHDCRKFNAKLAGVNQPEPLEAIWYPHALIEAKAKYASLYIISVKEKIKDGVRVAWEARDQRDLVAILCDPRSTYAEQNALSAIQRKIEAKLLAVAIDQGGTYQPPIWRIADE